MGGQKLPLKCSVDYISFSAHTDCNQTTDFIRELRPPHVVSDSILKKKQKIEFDIN
jgi:cleavage and polyadenylation specificity factor subunit 3